MAIRSRNKVSSNADAGAAAGITDMKKIAILVLLAAMLVSPAKAQTGAFGTGSYAGFTVGTTDSTIVPSIGSNGSAASRFLDIANLSATATVCINFGAPATIATTTCAAGEIAIGPLGTKTWQNSFVPSDVIHAIASAASTPVTVGVR
jgi:hypothetical protein